MTGEYALIGWLGFLGSTEPAELAVLIVVASVYAALPAGLVYMAISSNHGRDDEVKPDGENDGATDEKDDETVKAEESGIE